MGDTPAPRRPRFCGGVIDRGPGSSEGHAFDFCPELRLDTNCRVAQESLHPCTLALTYLLSLALPPVLSSYLAGGESHRVAEAGQGILLYASQLLPHQPPFPPREGFREDCEPPDDA